MASVAQLTADAGHLVSPRPGPGVCVDCFNFTCGFARCYACCAGERHVDLLVPISYSVAHEELHQLLATYKRSSGWPARRASRLLAAMLWRFLAAHEACVASRAGVAGFDVVTTVPSSDPARDVDHALRHIVGELCGITRDRHQRLLRRTDAAVVPRRFSAERYACDRSLEGARVLLIDDTWTTGASAESAAATLKQAGAQTVAGVVLGRHVNRDWRENDGRLQAASGPFDWSACALCAHAAEAARAA